MIFWFSAVALSVLASGLVWRAWVVRLRENSSTEASETSLYDAKIQEIDRDLGLGKIGTLEADAAKAEAGRQLIKSLPDPNKSQTPARASGWWMTIALVFIPFSSVALYMVIGNPPPIAERQESAGQEQNLSLDQLVSVVEDRLKEFPDDVQGWRVIVPVYIRQQRYEEAEIAFRNILRIEGDSANILVGLGEVLVEKSGGAINAQALSVFEKTLELDQNNNTARFYIGEAARQAGDEAKAIVMWQSMVDDADGSEDWLPGIRDRIEAAKQNGRPEGNSDSDEAVSGILALPEDEQLEQINNMVGGLAARLEADPQDKEGWFRLVRSYMVLGRTSDAQSALDNAAKHFADEPAFLEELGNLLTTSPGKVESENNE